MKPRTFEAAYSVAETVTSRGTVRSESLLVSPAVRAAIDLPIGVQVVGDVALPFGFGPSSGERAIVGYLSFEHALTKSPR